MCPCTDCVFIIIGTVCMVSSPEFCILKKKEILVETSQFKTFIWKSIFCWFILIGKIITRFEQTFTLSIWVSPACSHRSTWITDLINNWHKIVQVCDSFRFYDHSLIIDHGTMADHCYVLLYLNWPEMNNSCYGFYDSGILEYFHETSNL